MRLIIRGNLVIGGLVRPVSGAVCIDTEDEASVKALIGSGIAKEYSDAERVGKSEAEEGKKTGE